MSRIVISSKANEQFKQYKKLLTKKGRDLSNQFLVHGKHLVEEASKIPNLLINTITNNTNLSGTLFTRELMRELSIDNAFYEVIGVCNKIDYQISNNDKVLILDEIQDPSNVGTLLRTALSFGFNQVYVSPNTSDIYHEKCIRASQGAIFKLNVVKIPLDKLYPKLLDDGYDIITTTLEGNEIADVSLIKSKRAIVLGNEGQGVSDISLKHATKLVKIKLENDVDSLNVGAAAAIFMYLLR